MTVRTAARNTSSSRAIPLKTTLDTLQRGIDLYDSTGELDYTNPFLARPIRFEANQSGMQSSVALSDADQAGALALWVDACRNNVATCRVMSDREGLNIHKQFVNRLLEPFLHITALFTITSHGLANLLALRAHPDAQPEFQELATQMLALTQQAVQAPRSNICSFTLYDDPQLAADAMRTNPQWWHIPALCGEVPGSATLEQRCSTVISRGARISYTKLEKETTMDEDIAMCAQRLVVPGHWSPFEHVLIPISPVGRLWQLHNQSPFGGSGWLQLRKIMPNESRTEPRVELRTIEQPVATRDYTDKLAKLLFPTLFSHL